MISQNDLLPVPRYGLSTYYSTVGTYLVTCKVVLLLIIIRQDIGRVGPDRLTWVLAMSIKDVPDYNYRLQATLNLNTEAQR